MSKFSTKPTFIDLFAGGGLFSCGMIRSGFTPLLAIDIAAEAVSTYNSNLLPVAETRSVRDLRGAPRADVLIAGPPCQGFSTLGRMDPADVRNELCLLIPAWAKASKASIVVIENVPRFLGSGHWKRMTAGLKRQGYEIDAWELEAADFGVPQLRRRAFTIASLVGEVAQPKRRRSLLSSRSVFEGLTRRESQKDPLHIWPKPVGVAAERIALVPPLGDKRDIMKLAPELCPPSWFTVGCNATDVWGRMDPDAPANTLRCTFQNPSKGRYLHPHEDRVISLREGARLQGVPDSWQFVGRPYPIARQIGKCHPRLAVAGGQWQFGVLGRQKVLD
jgi:DNA (cytosine-5)-methyltransferase 1